jgi:hypothetical protein
MKKSTFAGISNRAGEKLEILTRRDSGISIRCEELVARVASLAAIAEDEDRRIENLCGRFDENVATTSARGA